MYKTIGYSFLCVACVLLDLVVFSFGKILSNYTIFYQNCTNVREGVVFLMTVALNKLLKL